MVVDVVRRADLLDPAVVHHHDAVGDLQRLLLIVRDEHAGDVHLVVQSPQPAPQLLPHLGVERAERLVEQQHPGLDGQRPRQRDALPLAAGELLTDTGPRASRAAPACSSSTHPLADLGARRRACAAAGRAARTRCSRTPSCGGTARSAGTRSRPGARCTREPVASSPLNDDAPGVGHFEPGDDPQQRGLARARRARAARRSSPCSMSRLNVVEGGEAPEALGDVPDFDAHALASLTVSASRCVARSQSCAARGALDAAIFDERA